MAQAKEQPVEAEGRSHRERSPSFPFVSLKTAIARLGEFDQKFGRSEPPADRVYLAWGYKGDTSQAQQTLAALKSFGLVTYRGAGPKRLVSLSEDGRIYLRVQQDSVRQDIIKRLALRPKWIAHFWPLWGAKPPPDEIRLDTLVLQLKFNENAAPKFLRVYDETIVFAGLLDSDKISPEHTKGEEGEEGGGNDNVPLTPPSPPPSKREIKPMVSERELTTGLLSKDGATFRLIVSGHIGVKEIERLIKKLEFDKEILSEPESKEERLKPVRLELDTGEEQKQS